MSHSVEIKWHIESVQLNSVAATVTHDNACTEIQGVKFHPYIKSVNNMFCKYTELKSRHVQVRVYTTISSGTEQ